MPEMTPNRSTGCDRSRPRSSRSYICHVPGARARAHRGRVVLDVAHALDAAGDDDIGGAGLDHHRRGDDRLQAAAAAPVDLQRPAPRSADRRRAPPSARCTAPRCSRSSARRSRRRSAPDRCRCACTVSRDDMRGERFGRHVLQRTQIFRRPACEPAQRSPLDASSDHSLALQVVDARGANAPIAQCRRHCARRSQAADPAPRPASR